MSTRAGLGEALERIDTVMGGLNSLQRERVTSILDDYYFGPTSVESGGTMSDLRDVAMEVVRFYGTDRTWSLVYRELLGSRIDDLAAALAALPATPAETGLREALRALSATDPKALPLEDRTYAETLAARLWHAADHDCTIDGKAILAALSKEGK